MMQRCAQVQLKPGWAHGRVVCSGTIAAFVCMWPALAFVCMWPALKVCYVQGQGLALGACLELVRQGASRILCLQ